MVFIFKLKFHRFLFIHKQENDRLILIKLIYQDLSDFKFMNVQIFFFSIFLNGKFKIRFFI